jgi:hypothetical protein
MPPRPAPRLRRAAAVGAVALTALVALAAGCSGSADEQVESTSPATFRPATIKPSTTAGRRFLSPDIEDQFARDMAAARGGGSPSASSTSSTYRSSTSTTSTTTSSGPSPTSSITPGSTSTTAASAPPSTEAAAAPAGKPAFCDPVLAFERDMRELLKEINGKTVEEAKAKVRSYVDAKGEGFSGLQDGAPESIKGAIANQIAWLNTLADGREPDNKDFESAVTTVRGWIEPNCGESI